MQIILQEVVPDYIEKENIARSQVWGKSLVIEKGEHLHIVAPSGNGKTSLMHFIYGLRKDYTGAIFYDPTDIKKLSPESFSSFRQKKISIIFQDLSLFPEQTVRENLEIKRLLNPYHKPVQLMKWQNAWAYFPSLISRLKHAAMASNNVLPLYGLLCSLLIFYCWMSLIAISMMPTGKRLRSLFMTNAKNAMQRWSLLI